MAVHREKKLANPATPESPSLALSNLVQVPISPLKQKSEIPSGLFVGVQKQ